MRWYDKLSFVSRIGIAIVLSLALNFSLGFSLKKQLEEGKYVLEVEVYYDVSSTMELHFDTGADFNRVQEVVQVVRKGQNDLQFPFALKEGEQLRFLRLDFGHETSLSEVQLQRLSLLSENSVLFDLNEREIAKHTGLLTGMAKVDWNAATFEIDTKKRPFDPYLVFSPLNELIYRIWQRNLFLLAPWLVVFFVPLLKWFRERFEKKEFALLLIALFSASIPLKIAWVTFTALLLLVYAVFVFFKTRQIHFSPGRAAVFGFFLVPLLFLGQGKFDALAIPLGFVIFPIIFSILDVSEKQNHIKKIYTKVFFLCMSIVLVNWVLLMAYNGYYYKVGFANYFSDIKSSAHFVMEWSFYPHTTFMSFFILLGGVFCLDLLDRQKLSKTYFAAYMVMAISTLLVLGSRFALVLAFLIPILYFIPMKHLKRIILPLWLALFTGTIYFIDKLDLLRTELWKISMERIKQNLWFGHGTGTSADILPTELAIQKNGAEALIGINHSHNQFLTYLLENGLLGTILITGLLLFVGYRYAKQQDKPMLLVTFSILFLMAVESPFKTATPLYLFSFLWCCFLDFEKRLISK